MIITIVLHRALVLGYMKLGVYGIDKWTPLAVRSICYVPLLTPRATHQEISEAIKKRKKDPICIM